jgi:hypothetical protein
MNRTDQTPPAPGNGQPLPLPPGWRKFAYAFNFQNTATGQLIGGHGEIVARDYLGALVKLCGLFADQPGRVEQFEFKDTTDQRIIERVPI